MGHGVGVGGQSGAWVPGGDRDRRLLARVRVCLVNRKFLFSGEGCCILSGQRWRGAGGTGLRALGRAESVPRGKGEVVEGKCHHRTGGSCISWQLPAPWASLRKRGPVLPMPGLPVPPPVPSLPPPGFPCVPRDLGAGTWSRLPLTAVKRSTRPGAWEPRESLCGDERELAAETRPEPRRGGLQRPDVSRPRRGGTCWGRWGPSARTSTDDLVRRREAVFSRSPPALAGWVEISPRRTLLRARANFPAAPSPGPRSPPASCPALAPAGALAPPPPLCTLRSPLAALCTLDSQWTDPGSGAGSLPGGRRVGAAEARGRGS